MNITTPQEAAKRLQRYLDRRAKDRGTDQEIIHGYDLGHEREATLTVADIAAAITALSVQPAPVTACPDQCDECRGKSFATIAYDYGWRCIECKKVYAPLDARPVAEVQAEAKIAAITFDLEMAQGEAEEAQRRAEAAEAQIAALTAKLEAAEAKVARLVKPVSYAETDAAFAAITREVSSAPFNDNPLYVARLIRHIIEARAALSEIGGAA
jgi:hypothetical protein